MKRMLAAIAIAAVTSASGALAGDDLMKQAN